MRIVRGIADYSTRRTFESVQEDVINRTLVMRLYADENGQFVPLPWVSDGGEVVLRAAVVASTGGDVELYHSDGGAPVLVDTLTFGADANVQVDETAPKALVLDQGDFLYVKHTVDNLYACEVIRYPKGGVEL